MPPLKSKNFLCVYTSIPWEAAHGEAVIRQGRRYQVRLMPVPPEQRAPILREYVRIAPSGRQHLPLPMGAPLSDFAAIAENYPAYRIDLS